MSSMEKNIQLHALRHMKMKPSLPPSSLPPPSTSPPPPSLPPPSQPPLSSTDWGERKARYSDAKDLILLLIDERNVGYVDAQGSGAFSLALQHPLLWTTSQSNACSQAGPAVEPPVSAHLPRKCFTFTRRINTLLLQLKSFFDSRELWLNSLKCWLPPQ